MWAFVQVSPGLEETEQLYATHGAEGALFVILLVDLAVFLAGAVGVAIWVLRRRAHSGAKHADRLEELQIDFVARGLERALGNGALSDIRTSLQAIQARLASGDGAINSLRDAVEELHGSLVELRGLIETCSDRIARLEARRARATKSAADKRAEGAAS